MNLEDMSVDELIEVKLGQKRQKLELKEEMRVVDKVYRRKVNDESIDAKIKAAGLEGVVVRPAPAVLEAEGN